MSFGQIAQAKRDDDVWRDARLFQTPPGGTQYPDLTDRQLPSAFQFFDGRNSEDATAALPPNDDRFFVVLHDRGEKFRTAS